MVPFAIEAELYCLVLRHEEGSTVTVGSMGEVKWSRGWTYYVGRASYGWSRRLRRFGNGKWACHWHVDYLVADDGTSVQAVIPFQESADQECSLAGWFDQRPENNPLKENFGASDCKQGCSAHCFFSEIVPEFYYQELNQSHLTPAGLVRFDDVSCRWFPSPE